MKSEFSNPTITIRRLEIPCYIGVPEEERAAQQVLRVSVEMTLAAAPQQDEIAQTVDYYAVSLRLKEEALARPRLLIETLARELGEVILAEFAVASLVVEVEKKILPDADWVAFRLEIGSFFQRKALGN